MRDRIAALVKRAPRLARLSMMTLLAAGLAVPAAPAAAVTIAVHLIATAGYEEAEAIQGAPGGLILKSAIDHRSALQRIATAPFAIGAPLPIEAAAIGPGPDGEVWAIVGTGGSWTLGAVGPAGFEPSHVLPQPGSSMLPNLVAAGPDGSLWVGDLLGADLERVLPDGRTLSYEGPQGAGYPTAIAFSGDGTAWVTETGTHEHIWEIVPTGQVLDREVASGRGQSGNCECDARSITAGPDGALWFAERMFGRIDRMTEAGEWGAFALPDPGDVPVGELGAPRPEALTDGPEGGIWFIDAGTGAIGRITLGGGVQVAEFPVPVAHPGAEISLQALTAYAGELWGTAVETVTRDGTVSSRRTMLLEVNPSGAPAPPAAAEAEPRPQPRAGRCPRAKRKREETRRAPAGPSRDAGRAAARPSRAARRAAARPSRAARPAAARPSRRCPKPAHRHPAG